MSNLRKQTWNFLFIFQLKQENDMECITILYFLALSCKYKCEIRLLFADKHATCIYTSD